MEQESSRQEQAPQVAESAQGYKLEHDRPNCIGCAACAAIAPDFWTMSEDGKSDIMGCRKREDGWEELDIGDKDLALNKDAAEACPVNVIHLTDKDGKKII